MSKECVWGCLNKWGDLEVFHQVWGFHNLWSDIFSAAKKLAEQYKYNRLPAPLLTPNNISKTIYIYASTIKYFIETGGYTHISF